MSIAQTNAARWMSEDMATYNYFSHTDRLGRDPFERMSAFNYDYATWKGENIAAGYSSGLNTFNQWRCSPGHNANMLNGNYRAMGLARFERSASTYRYYWTNDFGGTVDAVVAVPDPSTIPALPTTPCP